MYFILITGLISLLCLLGLYRTLKEKNIIGVGFSLISLAVFGWFTVMSTIEIIQGI